MRRLGSIIAALLIVGLLAPALLVAPVAAAAPAVPKVVIVVGPVGGDHGALPRGGRGPRPPSPASTRPDVTELYSPERDVAGRQEGPQGREPRRLHGPRQRLAEPVPRQPLPAHPERLRAQPARPARPTTPRISTSGRAASRRVSLAKDAVVLLNHLCYASGLSEPGLAEGTLDQAKQRVDNFAAGFIKAGASAVIAEAYTSPSRYVAAILGSKRSIESLWRSSPTANDNAFAFASERSPGYVAMMDPEHGTSGFERSIVLKEGLASGDVQAGARGSARATTGGFSTGDPGLPTLAASGLRLSIPRIAGPTSTGRRADLKVPFKIRDRSRLPKVLEASVRWDPVDVVTGPAAAPTTNPTPTLLLPESAPTALDLVAAEQTGTLVAPAALKIGKSNLSMGVNLPTAPGRYRLTITLHDRDGVAFDEATQALLPTMLVRVTGDPDGAVLAAPSNTLSAGTHVSLPVRVVNLGTAAWGHERMQSTKDPDRSTPAVAADLVGHWVALGDGAVLTIPGEVSMRLAAGPAAQPGGRRRARHRRPDRARRLPPAARRHHPGARLAHRGRRRPDDRAREGGRGELGPVRERDPERTPVDRSATRTWTPACGRVRHHPVPVRSWGSRTGGPGELVGPFGHRVVERQRVRCSPR